MQDELYRLGLRGLLPDLGKISVSEKEIFEYLFWYHWMEPGRMARKHFSLVARSETDSPAVVGLVLESMKPQMIEGLEES